MPDIDVLYIQKSARLSDEAGRARSLAPAAEMAEFDDLAALLKDLDTLDLKSAKRRLVIANKRGTFVKEFPAAPGVRSPAWHYLTAVLGCQADCRYCFLQGYHRAGTPIVFADRGGMLEEIARKSRELSGVYFYYGELSDALMLEGVAGLVEPLVDLFGRLPDARLELRTKSAKVDGLTAVKPAPNVSVAWTFSPLSIQERFEQGSAEPHDRIEAARCVQEAGYRVGIRFDPIILFHGWRTQYAELIGQIFSAIDPRGIDFVQMGCLRFAPQLKATVVERFGCSAPFDGEFVVCADGKLRYPRPVRSAAYAHIGALIASAAPGLSLSLCMETPAVMRAFASCGAAEGAQDGWCGRGGAQ